MTRKLAYLFITATMLATMQTSTPKAEDIIEKFRRERAQNSNPHLDVTHLLSDQMRVGMDVESATRVLLDSGFKIVRSNLPDGSLQLIGSRFADSGMMPFTKDEYRIILTVEGGKIKSISARIFLQTL